MPFNKAITEIIQERFSCRTYQKRPIDVDTLDQLTDFINATQTGPLDNRMKFALVSATDADAKALRGLGTYGFIRGATGFIVGAMGDGNTAIEDFGYLMELIISFMKSSAVTYMTRLRRQSARTWFPTACIRCVFPSPVDRGVGRCWVGGTFTKSRFAKKISLSNGETIPAVTSLGYIAKNPRWVDGKIRAAAGSDKRLPWEKLFFDGDFEIPLPKNAAGEYGLPLEMVRIAPSASNRQPWRIVKDGDNWHFFLRRTRGYRTSNYAKMLQMADLQRIDMGIAMCHFDLTAREYGIEGSWQVRDPGLAVQGELTEYSVSWVG